MHIRKLILQDIGPFDSAELEFGLDDDDYVTVITGENGTGKTLILDAIRTMFGDEFTLPDRMRSIGRTGGGGIRIDWAGDQGWTAKAETKKGEVHFRADHSLSHLPRHVQKGLETPGWVVDYWTSRTDGPSFRIDRMSASKPSNFLIASLSGIAIRHQTTEFICQVDYLRDSRDEVEQRHGEALWRALERVTKEALIDGELSRVLRSSYTPIFIQHGREVNLEHLNAGSLYLLQRILGLLERMYACYVLNKMEGSILDVPGMLLIDEAENHLHPKWQKRFLPLLRSLFPNLQIILTTHSPFIVASAPKNTKVYVCEKHDAQSCIVRDVSQQYGSLPIDEVLTMPVFSETQPFSERITELLNQRREAMEEENELARTRAETELKKLNPEEFAYFDLPEMLREALEPKAS